MEKKGVNMATMYSGYTGPRREYRDSGRQKLWEAFSLLIRCLGCKKSISANHCFGIITLVKEKFYTYALQTIRARSLLGACCCLLSLLGGSL